MGEIQNRDELASNSASNSASNPANQPPLNDADDEEISLLDLALVIAKHKRLIVKITAGAAALSIVVALLKPNIYTGKTTIMPPSQSHSSPASFILGQIGALGGLSGIDRGPGGVYVAMLKSRSVTDALIARFKLMDAYEVDTLTEARKALEGSISITAGKEGMITVEVDDKDAKRAADIANGYIDELDNLVRRLAVTEASRRRLFFEKQLKEAKTNLEAAESALKGLQERTGVIQLEGQSGAILSAEVGLRAQIAAKEIERSAMRAFATEQNPDYRRVEQMITSLREQLAKIERDNKVGDGEMTSKGKIPTMAIEYIHKMRDLKYNEKLFEFVAQQLASARIDEAHDSAVIQVVDKALPPERKSKPKRANFVILSTLVAGMLAVLFAFIKEALARAAATPESATRLATLRAALRWR